MLEPLPLGAYKMPHSPSAPIRPFMLIVVSLTCLLPAKADMPLDFGDFQKSHRRPRPIIIDQPDVPKETQSNAPSGKQPLNTIMVDPMFSSPPVPRPVPVVQPKPLPAEILQKADKTVSKGSAVKKITVISKPSIALSRRPVTVSAKTAPQSTGKAASHRP